MADLMEKIRGQARKDPRQIVLPETQDRRVIEAAVIIQREGIAKVMLLGKADAVAQKLEEEGGRAGDFVIRDPQTDGKRGELAEAYYQRRKHKGMTVQKAEEGLTDGMYFGAMLVKVGEAEGLVSGSISSTSKVLRAALRCLGPSEGVKTVSSCLAITTQMKELGTEGSFLFADVSVVPDPTAEQLADIAVSTAGTCRMVLQADPRVAMISFSTKGSAKHPALSKVIEATRLAKEAAPDLIIDGEMQIDAAIIESVCKQKAPDSPVAGRANVLVFPDLACANSSCKLAERLGGARAVGPILQGVAGQMNDLSRGCSVEDIVDLVALTCVQAQSVK